MISTQRFAILNGASVPWRTAANHQVATFMLPTGSNPKRPVCIRPHPFVPGVITVTIADTLSSAKMI